MLLQRRIADQDALRVQLPYLIVGHAQQFLEHSFIVLAKPGSAQFGAIGPGRELHRSNRA